MTNAQWRLTVLIVFITNISHIFCISGCRVDVCIAIARDVSEEDWSHTLEHVVGLVKILNIETFGNRVGLVSYDSFSTLDIALDKHNTTATLVQDVLSQTYGGSGLDLSKALFRQRFDCFDSSKGDRSDAENFAVLITSGNSDPDMASYEASLLRAEARILSVGVGPNVDHNLLIEISGDVNDVFSVATFAELEAQPSIYLYTMCPSLANFPEITQAPRLAILHDSGETDFRFECTVFYPQNQSTDAIYQVTFTIDGINTGHPVANLSNPDYLAYLPGAYLEGHMGKSVSCVVHSFWQHNTIVSPPVSSIPYYAGIKTSLSVLTISEIDQSSSGGPPMIGEVTVYSTVPVLCTGNTACSLNLQLTAHPAVLLQQAETQACLITLGASDWSDPNDSNPTGRKIYLQPKRYRVLTPHNRYIPVTFTVQSVNPYWQNCPPIQMDVHIVGGSVSAQCSATYDPNVDTFDNKYYGFWELGIFALFHNRYDNVYVDIATDPDNPQYICGVAVKTFIPIAYANSTSQRGQTHIIDRCTSETLQVLRCHEEDPGLVRLDPNGYTYIIYTFSGTRVYVDDKGNRLNVYVNIPGNIGDALGLCGNYNGDPDDDIPGGNLPEFLEENRYDTPEESYFHCNNYEAVDPPPNFALPYCQCGSQPLCMMGDSPEEEQVVTPLLIRNDNTRSSAPIYTDDVIYDYQLPPAYSGPIQNPERPAWGSQGVTEQEAEDACLQRVSGSASYEVCNPFISDLDMTIYMKKCMSDIQVTGDLSFASEHVSNFQATCEHNIDTTVNVTDPENPEADPQYAQAMGSFENSTCANNCSHRGYCDAGECVCDPGYIGADCSLEDTTPPTPQSYTCQTTCDVTHQPCTSCQIVAHNLVRSDRLSCRLKLKTATGESTVEMPGKLSTSETIKCHLPALLSLGNTSHPASYNYTVALSNNQADYSDYLTSESPHIVWNSDWMWWQCLTEANMIPKDNSCVIENSCFAEGHMKDDCYGCNPSHSSSDWTPAEEITEDTNLSKWSAFGECTKECDYGQSQRTRECTGGCCGYGERQQSTLCNTENCPELEFEKQDGVFIEVSGMTVDELVAREGAMHSIVNEQLNEYTNLHQDEFCAVHSFSVRPNPDIGSSLVQDNDTYTASGYPQPDSEFIRMKVITNVTSSNVGRYCDITSLSSDVMTGAMLSTNVNKQTLESEYMMKALENLDLLFKQMWGQDVGVTLSNPSVPDDVVNESNTTLIIATVVPITCLLIILAVVIPVVIKKKKQKQQKNTELNAQYKAPKSRPGSAKLPRNSVASIFVDPQEENLRYNTYERR